jgi:DNA-binding response OmpR family regulator
MTDVSGLDICRQIRMMTDTPLILVSVDHDGELVVGGLEIGVDDFADSHMSDRELLARVKVASRRPRRTHNPTGLPSVAGYEIDRRARSVTCPNGVQIELTNLEFDLLVLFVANPGVALEREVIFNRVWGQRGLGNSRTIDTHVVTLRNKIPELKLSSVHGIGYRLDPIALVA